MYWTGAQQLAHLTVNGAALRTGDLYGSGTVSSFRHDEMGSLLEMTTGGRDPITLPDGQTRSYLADGDTVTLSGSAPGPDGSRIEFGSASGQVTGPAG
jgi:fumarylacetoacetase